MHTFRELRRCRAIGQETSNADLSARGCRWQSRREATACIPQRRRPPRRQNKHHIRRNHHVHSHEAGARSPDICAAELSYGVCRGPTRRFIARLLTFPLLGQSEGLDSDGIQGKLSFKSDTRLIAAMEAAHRVNPQADDRPFVKASPTACASTSTTPRCPW